MRKVNLGGVEIDRDLVVRALQEKTMVPFRLPLCFVEVLNDIASEEGIPRNQVIMRIMLKDNNFAVKLADAILNPKQKKVKEGGDILKKLGL